MTVIKFDHNSPPSCVRVDTFRIVNSIPELGYWVVIGNNEIKLADGDYIIQDDNGVVSTYYSAAQYISDLVAKALIAELIGKELTRNIWAALVASAMSDANKASVATTITTVMVLIQGGQITSARQLANSLGTTAAFTAGVKNQLLTIMDASIAKL